MNTGSIIIGFILVVLFVLPFYYLNKKNAKKEKLLLSYFVNLAVQRGISISESEIWCNSYYIGIDYLTNKLFYLKKIGDKEETIEIDLNVIEKCAVNTISRTIKEGSYTTTIIDRIDLNFKSKTINSPEKKIEIYHAHENENIILSDQLQIAEKWKKIINKRLIS